MSFYSDPNLQVNAENGDLDSACALAIVFNDFYVLEKLALSDPIAKEKLTEILPLKYQFREK